MSTTVEGFGGGENITQEVDTLGVNLNGILVSLDGVGVMSQSGVFLWKKFKDGNFVEYVVSNDGEAYPTNGEKDGFYYEKILDLARLFGISKVVVTSFTPTYNVGTSAITVNHLFGSKPNWAFIRAKKSVVGYDSSHSAISKFLGTYRDDIRYSKMLEVVNNMGTPSITEGGTLPFSISATSVTVGGGTWNYFASGVEYELITFS